MYNKKVVRWRLLRKLARSGTAQIPNIEDGRCCKAQGFHRKAVVDVVVVVIVTVSPLYRRMHDQSPGCLVRCLRC